MGLEAEEGEEDGGAGLAGRGNSNSGQSPSGAEGPQGRCHPPSTNSRKQGLSELVLRL